MRHFFIIFQLFIIVSCGGGSGSASPPDPPPVDVENQTVISTSLRITSPSSFTVNENQKHVGNVSHDNDKGYSVTYSLGGVDSDSFTVSSNDGLFQFVDLPNYDVKNQYSVTLTAASSIETTIQEITVNVAEINEAPTRIGPSPEYIDLSWTDSIFGGQVATMQASDPNQNTTFIWSLENTNFSADAKHFSINQSTGVITYNGQPYPGDNPLHVRVRVSDGMLSDADELIFRPFKDKQIGNYINGAPGTNYDARGGGSGYGMDMNSAGNIVAIGAPLHNWNGTEYHGHVRVFQYNLVSGWTQLGSDIDGNSNNWGDNVSLNDTGNVLLVSSSKISCGNWIPPVPCDVGTLQVYEFDSSNNSWSARGSSFTTNVNDNDIIGDISGDGNTIAFGTQGQNLKVYRWNGSDYIFESNVFNYANPKVHSVSLSDNGNIIAVTRTNERRTEVFRYNGSAWSSAEEIACGDTIGTTPNEVALSSDGNKIAIGNPDDDLELFCVYAYDGSWNLTISVGGVKYGGSIDISDDGNTVAFAANGYAFVRVWKKASSCPISQHSSICESASWIQTNVHKYVDHAEFMGWKTRLNDAGDILSFSARTAHTGARISSPQASQDCPEPPTHALKSGCNQDGQVRVFDISP